jgi:uncharacterized membrane protein YeaQ/YmgE (transglycosylase-associated protein family)
MSLIAYLILLVISGLFVGALARLLMPGRDPMTIGQTILTGMAGSFLAGLLYVLLFRGHRAPGLIASVVCAMFIVWVVRRVRERQAGPVGPRRGGLFSR